MENRFNNLTSKEWLPFQKSWFIFENKSNLIEKISSNTDIETTYINAEIDGENKFIQLANNEIKSVIGFIEEAAILSDGSSSVVDILNIYDKVKVFSDDYAICR